MAWRRRRSRAGLAAVLWVTVAGLASASDEWGADLELSPDLPADVRETVENVLPKIAAAAQARFSASPPYVRVVASPDHREVALAYAEREGITGDLEAFARTWEDRSRLLASRDTIYLVANDHSPKGDALLRAIAHEYFHVLQNAASGPLAPASSRDEMGPAGPLWLVEGSAEYAQRLLTDDAGVYCDDMDRDRVYRDARASGGKLDALETKRQNDAARGAGYPVGAVAVEVLATRHGDPTILDYFRRLASSATWNVSFETTFNASPATFYAEFEHARTDFSPSGDRLPWPCVRYVAPRMIPEPGALAVGAIGFAILLRKNDAVP